MIHRSALSLVAWPPPRWVGLAAVGRPRRRPPPHPPPPQPERRWPQGHSGGAATATWSCGPCRPVRSAWSSPTHRQLIYRFDRDGSAPCDEQLHGDCMATGNRWPRT